MEKKCILWNGKLDKDGYGRYGDGMLAHRVIYENCIGEIPKGLEIDHICRIRNCVNTNHLRLVTHKENMQNSMMRDKTHCPKGHLYNKENTYFFRGTRHCRKCNLISVRSYKNRRRIE